MGEEGYAHRSCAPGVRTRDQSNCEIKGGAPSTGALGVTCVPFQGGTASKLGRTIYEAVLAWAKRTSWRAQGWAGEKVRSRRSISPRPEETTSKLGWIIYRAVLPGKSARLGAARVEGENKRARLRLFGPLPNLNAHERVIDRRHPFFNSIGAVWRKWLWNFKGSVATSDSRPTAAASSK